MCDRVSGGVWPQSPLGHLGICRVSRGGGRGGEWGGEGREGGGEGRE